MNIELISDVSYLSDGDGGENGNTTKQVRFNLHSKNSSSNPSIRNHFSDSFPRDNLELSVEDEPNNQDVSPQQPKSLPSVVSVSLDLSVLDEPELSRDLEALSLDVPQINTVRNLQEEVIKLAGRLHTAKNSSYSVSDALQTVLQKRRKETELLGGDGHNVCVNFAPEDRVYHDLLPLGDISEEDLIQEERDRLAQQRHRIVAEIHRAHPPKEEILPEPNLLKFFDPKRHIFQSARLDVPRLHSRQIPKQNLNSPKQLEAVRLDHRLCNEHAYYL